MSLFRFPVFILFHTGLLREVIVDGELVLHVYNSSLRYVAIIDQYKSLIWTDRFNECGDFELEIVYDPNVMSNLKLDYYCRIDYSNHWAVIEKIEYRTDIDSPPTVIITGRSIECLLERRIVIEKVSFENAGVQASIRSMLNTNIISPSNEGRKISNFIMSTNSASAITDLKFTDSFNGDDLLSVISGICQDNNIGFRITIDSSNQFVFQLYAGRDRSYSQTSNSYVVFAPIYDNLKNSSYYISTEDYKNTIIVYTDESSYRIVSVSKSGFKTGTARRETHINSSDLNPNKDTKMSNNALDAKARKYLRKEHKKTRIFEGEIVPGIMHSYMKDYNVGDIVQFSDNYGNQKALRIDEMVISQSESGLEMVPSFVDLDEE